MQSLPHEGDTLSDSFLGRLRCQLASCGCQLRLGRIPSGSAYRTCGSHSLIRKKLLRDNLGITIVMALTMMLPKSIFHSEKHESSAGPLPRQLQITMNLNQYQQRQLLPRSIVAFCWVFRLFSVDLGAGPAG
jgi:hypothetical protein